jgi:hypothetical protein
VYFLLFSVHVFLAVFLIYFISAAVILLASLAIIVQVSLPYNKTGRSSVLYNLILVFLRVSFPCFDGYIWFLSGVSEYTSSINVQTDVQVLPLLEFIVGKGYI